MENNKIGYIICVKNETDKMKRFYSIDCCGKHLPYWTDSPHEAKLMTMEEVETVLASPMFNRSEKNQNGEIDPPYMLYKAGGLRGERRESQVRLEVVPVFMLYPVKSEIKDVKIINNLSRVILDRLSA